MNAGVLAFDASGRITTLAVADFPTPFFNGGTPTGALGSLVIAAAGENYLGGIAYDDAGAIKVREGPPPPSLLLDFTSGVLNPLLSFTRNSIATYIDKTTGLVKTAAVNEPRFEAQGLLIEEARTNICLQSSDFSTVWTYASASAIVNATTAPDGAITADKLVEAAATAIHYNQQLPTILANTLYTFSVYLKAGDRIYAQLYMDNGSDDGAYVNLNLSAGTTLGGISKGGTSVSASIVPVGNGWYRCVLSCVINAVATAMRYGIILIPTEAPGFAPSYAGDGASGIYAWGAQLEVGAFATSYIPTTAATVTRVVDLCSMPTANIPSFSATEGTLFGAGELTRPATSVVALVSLDDGTLNERMQLRRGIVANDWSYIIIDNGAVQANVGSLDNPVSASARAVLAYKLNDSAACVNGGTVAVDVAVTIPTVTTLGIGQGQGLQQTTGHIRSVAYWPSRLSNERLQILSAGASGNYSGGLPIDLDGALIVSYDQAPVLWVAGIPLDAAGRVCLATPTPPFDLKAFSNAFAPAEFT